MLLFHCNRRLIANLCLILVCLAAKAAQSESESRTLYLGSAGPMHWALGELITDRFMPVLKEESAETLELKVLLEYLLDTPSNKPFLYSAYSVTCPSG